MSEGPEVDIGIEIGLGGVTVQCGGDVSSQDSG